MLESYTWWKGLLQLVSLLEVKYTEGVEVFRAPDLELDNIFTLLDLHRLSILSPGCEQEVLYLVNLLRLLITR